jgi:hypothetical protein
MDSFLSKCLPAKIAKIAKIAKSNHQAAHIPVGYHAGAVTLQLDRKNVELHLPATAAHAVPYRLASQRCCSQCNHK